MDGSNIIENFEWRITKKGLVMDAPNLTVENYQLLYQRSLSEPETFWAEQAKKFLTWSTPWQTVREGDFHHLPIKWFGGGELNACVNCLDRHLPQHAEKTALIWESDQGETKTYSYEALFHAVAKLASGLLARGVKKSDTVCIYLPMIPEAVIAMLACARIGATHCVVFGGFSAAALHERMVDVQCKVIITADGGYRGGKEILLKENVDEAVADLGLHSVIVVKRTGKKCSWDASNHVWYHDLVHDQPPAAAVNVEANQPLFILHTSGSTGKPKGIVHGTGGYLLYSALTFYTLFDYKIKDIYWCTADIGWITGHSYGVYGPLSQAATIVMFEGVPTYPTPARFWEIVDKYQISLFYTAPTALRMLMKEGDGYVKQTSRRSLRWLGSVGEPINPEVWRWYFDVVGEKRCPVIDTWWQTETGGVAIAPLPARKHLKPGAASMPFLGIVPGIVDEHQKLLEGEVTGSLVLRQTWPGMMQAVFNDPERFNHYFEVVPGAYFTGDGAKRDEEDDYWITGRIDDVLNISGHRIGTAEIESALLTDPIVAEAAVVGYPHEIKGQGIAAFITLRNGIDPTDKQKDELKNTVRKILGHFVNIDKIIWAPALPKTRSGKIMRRLLKKIIKGEKDNLGDLSTLANPEVISDLVQFTKDMS